jgi:septum site-determining protein MinC
MKQNSSSSKHRVSPSRSRCPASRRPRVEGGALGPRDLRALSKSELVALVLDLQARQAARATPAESPQGAAESTLTATPGAGAPAGARAKPTLVIDDSVRSGQTIEFPDGDVTVVGSVGSGAEIIAGGSIHVYGALRGRAIAGVSGDETARIFCQDLDAELLSIDGRYRVAENFDRNLRGRPVQARLVGMRMEFVELDEPRSAAPEPGEAPAARLRRATQRVREFMSLAHPRAPSLPETTTA